MTLAHARYNGHVTALDVLWSGVPHLTMVGTQWQCAMTCIRFAVALSYKLIFYRVIEHSVYSFALQAGTTTPSRVGARLVNGG